jgi:ABC-type transport system involved in multi-copper enzyme maturation permease subunit
VSGVFTICRRELWSYLASPLGWLLLTFFLLIQGYSFYLFVGLLSRPDSLHGAVMQLYFGGTLIYWLFLIAVVSLLTMRLIAGERRGGTLETLLTSPLSEGSIIVGKYLAALIFYVGLWLPTGVYVALLWALAGSGSGLDPGPVVAGYLGTFLVGASALAVGLLASTLAPSQIVAALASFAALALMVLLGLFELLVSSGWTKAALRYVNLFEQMDDFARGIVDSRALVFHGSLLLFCLIVAALALGRQRAAVAGRGGRIRSLATPAGIALLVLIAALCNVLAARHYRRSDWTRGRVYSLSLKAKAVLRQLKRPVRITLLMAEPGRSQDSIYPELSELLGRMGRASGQISVERVDPDLTPARTEVLAKQHNIGRAELREGVVVVAAGRRVKVVPARALADYEVSREGRRLSAFKGEAVLLTALLSATRGEAPTVCFTSGHGEAAIDTYAAAGYGYLADEVRRDGYRVRTLSSKQLLAATAKKLRRACKVIVIGGPSRAFAAVELDALDRYLRALGRVFVLLGPTLDRGVTRYGELGLEKLCARWGVGLPKTIVLDPVGIPGEQPLMTWATRDGYGAHPVGRALAGKLTVWPLAREVAPRKVTVPGLKVTALVSTSAKGWAESDLASLKGERPLSFDAALDRRGPVHVAAAVTLLGPRMVVFGSERGLLNRRLGATTVRDFNRDLFLASLGWLSEDLALVNIGPKTPEHLRLALDDKQLGRTFLVTVVALPLIALFAGVVAWWRRRR